MDHPFIKSMQNIELRLEELSKLSLKKQEKFFAKEIIDNYEFQRLFNISSGTAANWRDEGIISYHQIKSKIYYKIKDVNKMLNQNYSPTKKK